MTRRHDTPSMQAFDSVDAYIAAFPESTRILLEQLRAAIRTAAPDAEEGFGYGMPAYRLHGALVYFAGYARHVGFYPTASGIAAFAEELSGFRTSKGAVQLPLDRPLPLRLITRMVKFRVRENLKRKKSAKT